MLQMEHDEANEDENQDGDYCEVDLFLSADLNQDPPLTEEFVHGIIQQYSDIDEVFQSY